MRAKFRILTTAAGTGAAIVLLSLVIAVMTGSMVIAVLAGVLGLIGIVATCLALLRALARFAEHTDRLATRAKNLDLRIHQLVGRANERFTEVEGKSSELESSSAEIHERARLLEANAASLAGKSDEAETAISVLGKRTELLEDRADHHDDRIEGVHQRLEEQTTDHIEKEDSLAAVRSDLVKLANDQADEADRTHRIRRDVRTLRTRVPDGFLQPIEKQLAELRSTSRETLYSAFESAVQLGRDPGDVISERLAYRLFKGYLGRAEYPRLRPLIEHFDVLEKQSLTTLRAVYRALRAAGYWDLAARAVSLVHAKSGRDNDALAVSKIEHEIELFSHPTQVQPELPDDDAYDNTGPILHMVGRVLPRTQTGYTLRTQYTAAAQARKGLPVIIVGQAGISDHEIDNVERYQYQDIEYYLLPGPARNRVLIDEWLARNIIELGALVRDLKPSILHAQSDFFNALIVNAVGKKYGIPTVYESRGFWEESWLSRTVDANGWGEQAESLFAVYGRPAAYELRKHAEEVARLQTDHVFTLAEVMRDHILDLANGEIPEDAVSIVPNAVESANFPIQEPDPELAAQIGLPENAVVVGYISSMVQYEGIDTLLDAYQLAGNLTDKPICLLLVGDGDYLQTLKRHVDNRNIPGVYFTGRVPHEEVLGYYGLIDIFVVPRKASAVADLVTPLKPFEAFCTGRAVVLSDVAALKEIAEQSDSVETFRAGDANDLAAKLSILIEDSEKREQLGARASHWVRNHRSWEGNVAEYYRVYKRLGYAGPARPVVMAETSLVERGVNAADVLDDISESATPPLTGWFSLSEMKQSADDIAGSGWRYEEFEPVPVAFNPDWPSYGARNRTWGFNLHTWKFMEPLLREYGDTKEMRWLELAASIARGWLETYKSESPPEDAMAWYDMALALRTPMLLNLLIQTSKTDELKEDSVILLDALLWHMDKLSEAAAFNPNNNHGFYTAASQLHLAKFGSALPGVQEAHDEGLLRLEIMVDRQFAEDGVHLEHSPDYHRMLLGSFERAITDGIIEDKRIRDRIGKAAYVLGWMIQPNGHLVQFGDTPSTRMKFKNAHSLDAETLFIMSDGQKGSPPSTEMAVFAEGGYAFVRSPAPSGPGELEQSGYLALNAAFHSRAHKHADDLTIVWSDKGAEILVDSGRYGYGDLLSPDSPLRLNGFYYGSPERQYVEGTMAHNTLMMDGVDQRRRGRKPYGSAISNYSEKDGVFDLTGRAQHSDYVHRRRLIYSPGYELIVRDAIYSPVEESRKATLWFNIDGEFELESLENVIVFNRKVDGAILRLEVHGPGKPITPVRGQETPLRGWRSRRDRMMEPSWSLGFSFDVQVRQAVETVFRIDTSDA